MPTTDTSEKGLESLIVAALTGKPVSETLTAVRDERAAYGGAGYVQGDPHDLEDNITQDEFEDLNAEEDAYDAE